MIVNVTNVKEDPKDSEKYKNLKEKIEWLNKDIDFKTIKLKEYLDSNSDMSTQNYELRKTVIEK